MKKSVERLKLKTEDGDTELSFKTMTGQSDHSKQKTIITLKPSGTSAINLELFVIDADVTVTNPVKNVRDLWPNLERDLRQEVERNLVKGHIDILIGLDFLYSFADGTAIPHPFKGLTLMKTLLGYSMGGSLLNKNSTNNEVHTIKSYATKVVKKNEPTIIDEKAFDENRQEIQKAIMKMFETEALGLKEESIKDSKFTADEIYAMEQFKRHIEWKNGRYYVKPLLKKNFIPMKNNYHIALRRYKLLRRQLLKHPAQAEMYSAAIKKMIDNKEVEPIDESQAELADLTRYINYIPHFGVFRLDKSTT